MHVQHKFADGTVRYSRAPISNTFFGEINSSGFLEISEYLIEDFWIKRFINIVDNYSVWQVKMVERSCKVCAKPVNRKNPGLQCGSFCGRFYHGLCINIVGNMLDNLRSEGVMWTCLDCRNSRKSVGESTIPRSSHNTSDSASHALVEIREELAKIRESQAALLQSVEFCSHKISEFEREIKKLNEYTRKTDQLSEENKNMRLEMDDLHARINDLEQVSRLNNIEIQGVPEKKGEDLHRLVEEMGEQMDCTLVTSTIDYVHRVQLNQNTA